MLDLTPPGNAQKKPSEASVNAEGAEAQLKLTQGLLKGDFIQLGAQQPQAQNANLLNFAGGNGLVIYMMPPNANGMPYQPYHQLGQLGGYPIIEVVYPHQLNMLNGGNPTKALFQQDFANRFTQIPEYFNGQIPLIQPDAATLEGIIKQQQQKMEEAARATKANDKQEKPSPLDGNILPEKEIAKANQQIKKPKGEQNQISPNKLSHNISGKRYIYFGSKLNLYQESNSGAEDNGRGLNAEVSLQGRYFTFN